MDNNQNVKDIYLMGIGGVAMGSFAGLLQKAGYRVRGSDTRVYSPMKEKLLEWGIPYNTPYSEKNLETEPDLVIVGNVIRKDNPEAAYVLKKGIAHDSFPSALKKLFLSSKIPVVATGTHGKTTTSALLAHTLFSAGRDPGFLIGGIPLNFSESFRWSKKENAPFVVEGDEYDTSFFDKGPKFMHYAPRYLLTTSLEFDHADIYASLDHIIDAFSLLYSLVEQSGVIVVNAEDKNIQTALSKASVNALVETYGEQGDLNAAFVEVSPAGTSFRVIYKGQMEGTINLPLFGRHNLMNALGCYLILKHYGLCHQEIAQGFGAFAGVKRRLEFIGTVKGCPVIEDFAHHPTAVMETVKAVRQKYPSKKICAVFEPRSATSCTNIFQDHYETAFNEADEVWFAPLGRIVDHGLNIDALVNALQRRGMAAQIFLDNESLFTAIATNDAERVFLLMSNGDFQGELARFKSSGALEY